MPHGNIQPDTIYFPKGIQLAKKELTAILLKPLADGAAPCGPELAHLSPASATAQYIAPEHLASAKQAVDSDTTQIMQPTNPLNGSSLSAMAFQPDVQSDGRINPLSSASMSWGLEASTQFLSAGPAACAMPTPASDCYQLGCVLLFAATGGQSQQHDGDLEARVIEIPDARGGPVGRILTGGTKLASLIRGLLTVDASRRLTAEQVRTAKPPTQVCLQ